MNVVVYDRTSISDFCRFIISDNTTLSMVQNAILVLDFETRQNLSYEIEQAKN